MINSHHIETSEYGIVTLLVNTQDKWVKYMTSWGLNNVEIIIIPEQNQPITELKICDLHLDLATEHHYVTLEQQDKDQIAFYFIPIRLIRGDKYLSKIQSRLSTKLGTEKLPATTNSKTGTEKF